MPNFVRIGWLGTKIALGGELSPPGGEWGGKMNFGQRGYIPTYSSTIQTKFHWNRTIFSKKHFYEKIVRYTGRLGGGRRGLAPPIEIVVLEVLIRMQVTGFSLKSIVFELFAFFYFGPAFDKTLGGAGGEGGGLGPKWDLILLIGW